MSPGYGAAVLPARSPEKTFETAPEARMGRWSGSTCLLKTPLRGSDREFLTEPGARKRKSQLGGMFLPDRDR